MLGSLSLPPAGLFPGPSLPPRCAQVDVQQVLEVRRELLEAGNSVWEPLDMEDLSLGADEEVNQSLRQMLGRAAPRAQANPTVGARKRRKASLGPCSPCSLHTHTLPLCA